MAEKKKKKSRLKKILKTIGKIALAGGAAYGASKLFGGRKGAVSTVGQPTGTDRAAHMPAHLGETFHQKWGTGVPDRIKSPLRPSIPNRRKVDSGFIDKISPGLAYGQQWFGAKKGGRVTGIAKRGFGRALMKGKK